MKIEITEKGKSAKITGGPNLFYEVNKMEIDQEIRYKTGDETYPAWIRKIAKTGNFYIDYYIDKVWGVNGHYSTTRGKWVKPTEEKEDGFMIVIDFPPTPVKKIVKSCNNCDHRFDLQNCSNYVEDSKYHKGYDENCNWAEWIGYDDGSTQDISDEAWEKFVYGDNRK